MCMVVAVGLRISSSQLTYANNNSLAALAHSNSLQDNCQGDKNQSLLKVKLKVLDGRIRLDKESRNAFEPSDLFKCRSQLSEKKRQRFEKELLADFDNALLSWPRFYVRFLKPEDRARLMDHLPAEKRDEIIPFLREAEKIRFFVYLPPEEQLPLISKLSLNQKKEFFAYLPKEAQDKVLEGLSEQEQATLKAKQKGEPPRTPPPANEALRLAVAEYPGVGKNVGAGNWQGFIQAYDAWKPTGPGLLIEDALDTFLTENLSDGQLRNTPILGFGSTSSKLKAQTGELTLNVTDPIGDLTDTDDYVIRVSPLQENLTDAEYITPPVEKIRSALQPLKGELWKRQRIARYINDYFIRDRTGYERDDLDVRDGISGYSLQISNAAAEPKCIVVPAVPQFARILFIGEWKDSDISKALRELLTDAELKRFRKNPKLLTKCEDRPRGDGEAAVEDTGVTIKCQQVTFEALVGEENEPPYLNKQNWQAQQAGLAQAGFSSVLDSYERPVTPPAVAGESAEEAESNEEAEENDDDPCQVPPLFLDVRLAKSGAGEESIIEPNPSPSPTPTVTPTPAATPTLAPFALGFAPLSVAPVQTPTPTPSPLPAGKKKINKPKRNKVGAELVYRPDQGVRVYGQYAHTRPGKDDFSVRFGGDGGFLISGDYEGADLFLGRFERQFPFAARSYSDSIANRIFNNLKMDERRSGGVFRVTTDLRTNPTLLSLSFEARHETVELADEVAVVSKQNISSITLGATYSSSSKGARFRRVWQFEPVVKFGLGVSNQPRFSVFHGNGRLHQYLPGQFDLIFDGRFDLASKNTPVFEQPSFGSSETVRGFRADDAIGRRQWALKNEFVMPVPGTSPDSTGLMKTVRERLKIATFLDVGGIYDTFGSRPGVRYGPGVGLRFTYGIAELQLDWAYGLGDASTGRGRGRFYFSVSREIPRLIKH